MPKWDPATVDSAMRANDPSHTGPLIGVMIDYGCLLCGACEVVCPEVFVVGAQGVVIRADAAAVYASQRAAIEEASENCCVEVIRLVYATPGT